MLVWKDERGEYTCNYSGMVRVFSIFHGRREDE